MLGLLSLLQTHRYWPGGELAGRLEISERTLRRDVDRLRTLGYLVDSTPGVAGGYQLKAGATMPPLVLDEEEAVAIAVGLRTAAGGSVAGIEETALRALTKLAQVLPTALRRRVDTLVGYTVRSVPAVFRGPTVDSGTLTTIAQACQSEERLRFEYAGRTREPGTRLVEPHRLVSRGHLWYLVAWDLDRHDWRSFRVDRMTAPTPTRARFRPRDLPGDGDAAAFVEGGIAVIRGKHDVRVLVHTAAASVERVIGEWGRVEPIDTGSCWLRMSVDELDWPVMVLGAIGAPFTEIEPPDLRVRLREVGDLLTRHAGPA
jgi:predicted DNA-binding transcriptional regulator YafY